MKLIKRNGSEAIFDGAKIFSAIEKANSAIDESSRIGTDEIKRITDSSIVRSRSIALPSVFSIRFTSVCKGVYQLSNTLFLNSPKVGK